MCMVSCWDVLAARNVWAFGPNMNGIMCIHTTDVSFICHVSYI